MVVIDQKASNGEGQPSATWFESMVIRAIGEISKWQTGGRIFSTIVNIVGHHNISMQIVSHMHHLSNEAVLLPSIRK